jgi:hypothetical protein
MCAIVELSVPPVRIEAVPTFGNIEVPIAAIDDGRLGNPAVAVGLVVPTAEVVGVPVLERVVPVVAVVVESVVVVELPVSEVRAGSVAKAEVPTPNRATKVLKSVVSPKPRVASNASKSGSGAVGVTTPVSGGSEYEGVLVGATDVVVVPPNVVPEVGVVVCANAAHGVATSAMGASQPKILRIAPPCQNLHVHIDIGGARVVPRDERTNGL